MRGDLNSQSLDCQATTMRNFRTQPKTVTSSEAQKKGKRRRVFFKLSHHALGVFRAADNPLFKKPRLGRAIMDVVEEEEEEDEEEEEEEEEEQEQEQEQEQDGEVYKPARREDENLKPQSSLRTEHRLPALFQPLTPKAKPKSYLEKLQARLSGGQFRMLNEKLYLSSGDEAFEFFNEDPTAFQCYHAGYQEQMSRWPSQPLDAIINWLKKKSTSLVVADFGCGNGKLAKNVRNQVVSLDLVASDKTIIACNMAHTPLKTHSVDVTVFCLSLMGTDYSSFLTEAHRVLKPSGTLLIAEVRSRFDPNNGGADPAHFIKALKTLGFSFIAKDFSNKLFVVFEFSKQASKGVSQQCQWPPLKPCIYKRR